MIVRKCFTSIAVFIVLTLLGGFDGCAAERWSRQISNSEWIPLANPGTAAAQLSRGNAESGLLSSSTHLPNPIQTLALPPALQQQYQEQLIQLQKTQDSIQKLLLLQQQLKAQQQLLQTQSYLPSDYSNTEDEKQVPSSDLPSAPELASEALIPPQPASEALPPVRPSQNFLSQKPGQAYQNQELSNLPVQGQVALQHGQHDGNVENAQEGPFAYVTKQGSQRPEGKRLKGQSSPGLSQSSLIGSVGDEEEEIQLVYVPAETLAQRGQPKKGRGRKQYPVRQQHLQRENQGNIDQTSLSLDQEAFTRQVLQQIQKEHQDTAQFLKEERIREFTRLNEEQKALERKTRLQQEALQREQELLRQKEADKKRKELERLEEMARQRELDRIREAREKQRQEELERRRLSELRIKEEKRREEEARQREERQKLELEQQRILESQQEDQLRVTSPSFQNAQSQSLIREQPRRQHLTEGTRIKKIRGRPRPRVNQYQEQSNYREVTTTPSPNQPPLSVYMGSSSSRLDTVKVTDVLKILRNAKTIDVLENVGSNNPQVFVGPSNLDPPYGYAKFDLPYLSSIDHNRVERKVDKLPFFVAPLSFNPPPGYSKIPFPAPHIGSVVINNLSETSSEPNTPTNEQNLNPTPLIELNSYSDADQSGSIAATTAPYESSTTQNFSPESSSPKYESIYSTPPSSSKFRFRQYYDNKPSPVTSYGEQSTAKTKPKHYYEQETKLTTQPSKVDTTASYRQEVIYSSTPNFQDRSVSTHDPSTKEQDLAAQLALINQELGQQRESQKYNTAAQYHSQSNLGESYDANDVRGPVGPTQYNLPAELPPISPHLPGLVNSLLDKQEGNLPVTPTLPPTTTTTTTPTTTTVRISSTTYRPRGRSRTVPTRPRTTQAPGNKTERPTRRPTYNRSKSRFTTTTEDYRESSYEPTKAKTPETTQKYNSNTEHRRPATRTQKYRNRDRVNSQSAVQHHNVQAANFENYPQIDSQSNTSPDTYSPPSGPAPVFHQKETPLSGINNYPENYSTDPMQTENYPPLREVTVQHSTPLVPDDYSRNQNYPQNRPQEARYQHAMYDQNDGFQPSGLEKTPVNGFNYQVVNENLPDQIISQRPKEYPRYQEEANYNLATTVDPRVTPGEEHRYSPIYEVNVAQTQPDYNAGKIESTAIETDPNASPIFVPLQQSKQEDYELQIPSTEPPLMEITTTSTTTPAPVIIRQRVRARLGGRTHHDSTIQTRPRGSQDEYVRFSVVNNDSGRVGHRHRDGSRTRTRTRPQSHGSQVQTEGNEYIKIHAAQQQKLVATTIPPPSTTTTTTARTVEEDVDYGFIRPPNFRPVEPGHPVDSRFQAPVTYRPALSEIQHILSNDETAVESSPAHILKNRPKYHQISTRRPTTKIFATTTSRTTTETIPIATTMPDDAVYTVKSKTKPDESKLTRPRGRIRRPGKKRITTTTESALETNNELPLDENYPRITPPQLPVTASGQQPLYDDNFDVAPQFVPNQNRPTQFYEENSENYPPQEFVLNFGNLPEQVSQREEYDQTQLASIPPRKYSHSNRPDVSAQSTGDIYGAESQWSTKLSKTSFQPSFASNRVAGESKRSRGRTGNDQEKENVPEIITAGPEVSSMTVVVSSDYQKRLNDSENMSTMMDGFGWKTTVQDHTEKLNATIVTNSPTTILQDQSQNNQETLPESRDWMNNKSENFTKQMDDGTRVTKSDSLTGRKTRRRKVRVRVRPLEDDFVTAESQHYNTAVNSLAQDQYKYNPIRESRFTTAPPIATTITAGTTTTAESTKKSLLQDFLEEMLKNDEVSIPTRITSTTTEIPDWTISTLMTTPMTTSYVFSDDGEITTLKENYTPSDTTLIPNIDEEGVTTEKESPNESKNKSQEATSEGTTHLLQGKTEVQKEAKPKEYKNSQENKNEQNNLRNIEVFNQRYNLLSNYPDGSGTSKKNEDSVTNLASFPKEEIGKLSAISKEKEHVMTLKRQEYIEDNEAHPKNHRIKWSEVRYPAFDKSQTVSNSYSTTPFPGIVTRDEDEDNVKTLSDYVKAIFDSMKNAEDGEEVAKVIETKNETDNYNLNDTASAHAASAKESEEIDRKADTTDSPQDTSERQRIKVEENRTRPEETQEATTKESSIEATTLIPDSTTTTMVPFEETLITEPSTTTTKALSRQMGKVFRTNSTMLGKVLKTSTTTRVSHMTEICYRGRCVMTRPKMEDDMTR